MSPTSAYSQKKASLSLTILAYRFMQSDPWWSFAMAINVYMVFFMSFNPATFRQYLWLYCVICFGLPAIPSFVFLFLREDRGLVYGDAAVSNTVPRCSSCAITIPQSSNLPSLTIKFARSSYGVGSVLTGTHSAFIHTTSQYGSAQSYLLLSILLLDTMCSTSGTSCATFP